MKITLGTLVRFSKISEVRYEELDVAPDCQYGRGKEPRKLIFKTELKTPFEGMVIGKVKRATGQYGRNLDEGNCLVIDKFHDFYEVRTGLKNKPVMVHPDDVDIIENSKINITDRNDLVFSETPRLYSEGNNGGDFFDIEEIEPGLIRIESGSSCVYNHHGVYPTEYLTRLLEYASLELTPEKILSGWDQKYVNDLIGKIK